jgi:hypothetical protein
MNAEAAAKKIFENSLPLDSVAQFRNVGVKLCLVISPLAIFVLVMIFRKPGQRLYVSSTEIALAIAILGTALNLDFRPHRIIQAAFHIVKWWVFLVLFVELQSLFAFGESLLKAVGRSGPGVGLERLSHVEGRVWLLIVLMVVFVPACVRLLTLRDARSIAAVLPSRAARRALEVTSITFFLITNTFGRRIKAAWQVASEKRIAAKSSGDQRDRRFEFWRGFFTVLLRQSLDVVLLAGSLVSERGFRRDEVGEDCWSWSAYGPEDVVGVLLLIGLVSVYVSRIV